MFEGNNFVIFELKYNSYIHIAESDVKGAPHSLFMCGVYFTPCVLVFYIL